MATGNDRGGREPRAISPSASSRGWRDGYRQKPWKPGERILPHNFGNGRDYRGGNVVHLTMQVLDRGYADPRVGRLPPDPGGARARPARARRGRPSSTPSGDSSGPPETATATRVLDDEGRQKLEWVQRDRPIVKLHHVFNVEQTEGLKLRSLAKAPEWEGHERAEALIRSRGIRLDHVAGDRAYYSLKDDRWSRPSGASSTRSRPTRTRRCTSWATRPGTRTA